MMIVAGGFQNLESLVYFYACTDDNAAIIG